MHVEWDAAVGWQDLHVFLVSTHAFAVAWQDSHVSICLHMPYLLHGNMYVCLMCLRVLWPQAELRELDAAVAGTSVSRLNAAILAGTTWISTNSPYPSLYNNVAAVCIASAPIRQLFCNLFLAGWGCDVFAELARFVLFAVLQSS